MSLSPPARLGSFPASASGQHRCFVGQGPSQSGSWSDGTSRKFRAAPVGLTLPKSLSQMIYRRYYKTFSHRLHINSFFEQIGTTETTRKTLEAGWHILLFLEVGSIPEILIKQNITKHPHQHLSQQLKLG